MSRWRGIRDLDTARKWLDAGAEKIIIGTKATPISKSIAQGALHRGTRCSRWRSGCEGWTTGTGQNILTQMKKLRDYVSGFLVTFVECEGRMGGTRMEQVAELVAMAGDARVTIAGGITTAEEIAELDALGADAQVGMALYTGKLALADAFAAPFKSDRPDGLWPTVVVDQFDRALGLCYSNLASITAAIEEGKGVYWSRKRAYGAKAPQAAIPRLFSPLRPIATGTAYASR